MSRREQIEIDFAKAVERAETLEGMAMELYRLAKSDLPQTMQLLQNSFRGSNGESFAGKGAKMGIALFDTADGLMKTARNKRFTAELIYRAEKAAVMLV